jgi:bacterial/archaeal transporter family-2 protein
MGKERFDGGETEVRGILSAILAGACITFQGVANTRISQDIGTWQAATVTQFTGFLGACVILMVVRGAQWRGFRQVRPLYLTGGAFGALIVSGNIVSIKAIGVTLTISALLIAQLSTVFLADSNGWFGVVKQKMELPHFVGIALMIAGVVTLAL